jgi:hypothetical protein
MRRWATPARPPRQPKRWRSTSSLVLHESAVGCVTGVLDRSHPMTDLAASRAPALRGVAVRHRRRCQCRLGSASMPPRRRGSRGARAAQRDHDGPVLVDGCPGGVGQRTLKRWREREAFLHEARALSRATRHPHSPVLSPWPHKNLHEWLLPAETVLLDPWLLTQSDGGELELIADRRTVRGPDRGIVDTPGC